MPETFTQIIDFLGVISFAISGAIVGIRKKMDVFGIVVLGIITSTGGGLIRDVIVGNHPVVFQSPLYVGAATVVSVIALLPFVREFFLKHPGTWGDILLIFDTLGLASFTVTGAQVGHEYAYSNHPLFMMMFMGTLTGIGGSILRDMMAQELPDVFIRHFYALAALSGSLIYGLLWNYVPQALAMIVCFATVVVLRLLAATFHWNMPGPDWMDRWYSEEKRKHGKLHDPEEDTE